MAPRVPVSAFGLTPITWPARGGLFCFSWRPCGSLDRNRRYRRFLIVWREVQSSFIYMYIYMVKFGLLGPFGAHITAPPQISAMRAATALHRLNAFSVCVCETRGC